MLGHIKIPSTAKGTIDTTSSIPSAASSNLTHSNRRSGDDHVAQAIVCSMGTIPSFVLEVLDVPTDCSAESVIAVIQEELPAVHVLKVDRNAMVKFRRHKEVGDVFDVAVVGFVLLM